MIEISLMGLTAILIAFVLEGFLKSSVPKMCTGFWYPSYVQLHFLCLSCPLITVHASVCNISLGCDIFTLEMSLSLWCNRVLLWSVDIVLGIWQDWIIWHLLWRAMQSNMGNFIVLMIRFSRVSYNSISKINEMEYFGIQVKLKC